jgi:hypothetical protein
MRSEGRTVKEGCQAMKSIKMRAGTVGRMRELEVLREGLMDAGGSGEGDEREMMQGLYARNQTEPYVPEPVVDVSGMFFFLSPFSMCIRLKFTMLILYGSPVLFGLGQNPEE